MVDEYVAREFVKLCSDTLIENLGLSTQEVKIAHKRSWAQKNDGKNPLPRIHFGKEDILQFATTRAFWDYEKWWNNILSDIPRDFEALWALAVHEVAHVLDYKLGRKRTADYDSSHDFGFYRSTIPQVIKALPFEEAVAAYNNKWSF